MRQLISRIFAVAAILAQFIVLDYYMILYNGISWTPIIAADLATLALMFLTYFLGNRYVRKYRTQEKNENQHPAHRRSVGILPHVYVSWFCYSAILVIKICLIFKTFGPTLGGEGLWGTNLLEFVIAGTAGIFAFMVAGRCRRPTTSQKTCLEFMQHHVLIEIIDCVEFLTILFTTEHHLHNVPLYVTDLILGFACVNMLLPTIGLYQLSATNFSRAKPREHIYILQTILSTVFGNIPYLIIRVYLWTDHEFTNALFVMKNIIAIGQNLKELFHFFHVDKKAPHFNHKPKKSAIVHKRFPEPPMATLEV